MKPRRICIVTDELFPFTAGGIGRLVHNVIQDCRARGGGLEFHLLIPPYVPLNPSHVEAYFQGEVSVHWATFRAPGEGWADDRGLYPPVEAFTDTGWHSESLDLMLSLRRLMNEGLDFEAVEFPDFRGWALCTLQEKKLGLGFQDTEISVRLHSTHGVLLNAEPHSFERENLGRYEVERKALLDADRVVAHLPAVAEFNRRYYGFDERWMERVSVEFPPVVIDAPATQPVPAPASMKRNILFLTKIQPIKRPDLFVLGVAALMRNQPAFQGKAILACHAFDAHYRASIEALVPEDLRHRFVFTRPGPDREQLYRSGIVVIPSDYESLNLTAYEASVAGASVVLNGANIAFGERTPFVDGENCFKFDGTAHGLALALDRALRSTALPPVGWTPVAPGFETRRPAAPGKAKQGAAAPLVSVVITSHNQTRHLPELLRCLAGTGYPELETLVVDDGSDGALDREQLEAISRPDSGVRLIRNPVALGLSASRNLGIRAARGQYVLLLSAEDRISSGFLRLAVDALQAAPEFSGVVPTVGRFDSEEELEERLLSGVDVFLGDAPSYGLLENRLGGSIGLFRRQLLEQHPFDERLSHFEDWDLMLQCVHQGHRFLVTNQVHAFRPTVPEGQRLPSAEARYAFMGRIYERLTPGPATRLFFPLTVTVNALRERDRLEAALAQVQGVPEVSVPTHLPLRHKVVDALNNEVKRLPGVHPFLKSVAAATRDPSRWRVLFKGSFQEPAADDFSVRPLMPVGPPAPETPLRYELVDAMNRSLRRLPLIHPLLRWSGDAYVRRRGT